MILLFSIAIPCQNSMPALIITIIMMIIIMLTPILMVETQLDSQKFALAIGIIQAWTIRTLLRNHNFIFLKFCGIFGSTLCARCIISTIPNHDQDGDGNLYAHCDDMADYYCTWPLRYLLLYAVPSQDGYVTPLNCPKCGCTPGQNDAITMNERIWSW